MTAAEMTAPAFVHERLTNLANRMEAELFGQPAGPPNILGAVTTLDLQEIIDQYHGRPKPAPEPIPACFCCGDEVRGDWIGLVGKRTDTGEEVACIRCALWVAQEFEVWDSEQELIRSSSIVGLPASDVLRNELMKRDLTWRMPR